MRRMADDVVTMEKIVALCKRRGFVFPASEIYGGIANTYDYGHYGVLLKRNVIDAWWRAMIFEREDIVALDSAIIQHPRTWKASGHLEGFTDPLVDCRTCKSRFRADHLIEERLGQHVEGATPDEMSRILQDAAVDGRVRRFTKRYKRYRADIDREGRRYKGDEVKELLYYARLR